MGGGDAGGRGDSTTPPVVTNASPLIALERIGRLDLLGAVYGQVLVPPAVLRELGPAWSTEWAVQQTLRTPIDPRVAEAGLGAGESEAIALALEVEASQIVLDDGPARQLATRLGLHVVGTAGVLLAAKQAGLLLAVRPSIEALLATGFHLGSDIVERTLEKAGEAG